MVRCVRLLAAGLLFTALVGCGGGGVKRVNVSGTVSLDGQPLESGLISFTPADRDTKGGTAAGQITSGKYSVSDVSPGKNRIEIEQKSVGTGAKSYEDFQQQQSKAMAAAMNRGGAQKEKKASEAAKKIDSKTVGNNQIVDVPKEGKDGLDIKLLTTEKK